jgi:hypothetical protein
MSELSNLEVMLHRELLVVVRFQLLSQFFVVSEFLGTDKKASSAFATVVKRELVIEDCLFRPLLVLAFSLIVLLLHQSVSQSSCHLYLALTFVIPIILCPLDVDAYDFLLHVKIGLILIFSPLLPLLYLPLLFFLNQQLLDSQLLDSWILLNRALRN